MPSEENPRRRHILLSNRGTSSDFVPLGWSNTKYRLASQDREEHGERIKQQLEKVQAQQGSLHDQRELQGIHGEYGTYIEVDGENGYDLNIDSLEDLRFGIEVVNVREEEGTVKALLYVPEGKIKYFLNKVEAYLIKTTENGAFRNKNLVESIGKVYAATLKSFWTDIEIMDFDEIPNGAVRWWEVWLRAGESDDEREKIYATFNEVAQLQGIRVIGKINFPERTVVLAKGSKGQLSGSIMLLDCLAEIRAPRETAQSFMSLSINEQRQWMDDLLARVTPPAADAPAVCILDTGVNNGHPLLSLALSSADMHAYKHDWGVSDDVGHGTEVAGIALYGDLVDSLTSMSPISLQHRLESVKIFKEEDPHEACLYGEVTKESIASAESGAPNRSRTVCLTVASEETRLKGNPTSWSAALDQLAVGAGGQEPHYRLIAVAAGNIRDESKIRNYPNSNYDEGIHDPGQAWNVLTVGAYTEKDGVDPVVWPDWIPIAGKGALAPSSTTTFHDWEPNGQPNLT